MHIKSSHRMLASCALMALLPGMAFAQTADSGNPGVTAEATAQTEAAQEADIVVTARKRVETTLSTPVVIQAISAKQLAVRGISTLEGFGRTVPSLMLGDAAGATQGGVVALRGIAGGESSPFGESAVSFNVDGVDVARASVRRMSELDLAQIEVLKGPQALYSGKNSAAGIIVITSADPTDHLEVGGNAGYEFYSHEWRGEGYVSTPITDSLGIRLAGLYSDSRGDITNVATPSSLLGPRDRYPGGSTTYGGRVTLKFDNGGPFTAKFKLTASRLKAAGADGTAQHVNCPYGAPHASTATVDGELVPANVGGPDTCKADGTIVRADVSPNFASVWPAFGDGVPRLTQNEMISGLALNYDFGDFATLTSQTGYYRMRYHTIAQFADDDTSFPVQNFGSDVYLGVRELSEDLHLTSKLKGPFNFILGAYYQDQKLFNSQISATNATAPFLLPGYPNASTLHNKTASVYGSVSFKPIDTVEISGGGRYTHETQNYAAYTLRRADGTLITDIHAGLPYDPSLPGGTIRPHTKYNNFSPEVTLSYRPTSRLTAFASYKQGFLAGGFQTGSGILSKDQSYGQEKVKGFEAGFKGLILNGSLRFDLSAFDYKITGQQVSATIFQDGASINVVNNAATSRVKGVEANASWSTPIKGLSLRGGGAYNHSRYTNYTIAPCYAGQTVALGCTNVTGAFAQDLSGQQLVRAPDWGAFLGGTLEGDVAQGWTLGLSSDANYTSGFFTDGTNNPNSREPGFWLLDSTLYLRRGPMEFSLVGRNLTDKRYFQRSIDAIFSGTTNADHTQGVLADSVASVSRGREIWLKVAYKFKN